MLQQPHDSRPGKVERELRLPMARAQLMRYVSNEPIDVMGCPSGYRVDLSLTPRPINGGACFRDRWGPHRFERIGDIFLIPPGEYVRARGLCGDQRSVVCEFDPKAVEIWFDGDVSWTDRSLEASLDVINPDMHASLSRLAREMRNPGFGGEAVCELLAAQMAIDLARYCNTLNEVKASGGLAPWRLKLIDERLAELGAAPALSELANLCNLSVRQLTRGFRASRDCSIGEHIARMRMNQAKHLLATEASVKEIAYLLGFSSPSNFSTTFHRATGLSPRQFRQQIVR